MDPSMDLPTPTTEPPFNPAPVLNHVPDPTQTQTQTQIQQPVAPSPSYLPTPPPYAEMITAAITALNERDGSSRIAIARFIDRAYPNLPPNHSALLTHHLKRLKNSGYLAMVKHSYVLAGPPGSAPPPPAQSPAVDANGSGGDVLTLTKRKPGRPPKPKPEAQAQYQTQAQAHDQFQAQYQPQFQQQPQFEAQQPNFFQQQPQYPQFQPQMQYQLDPLLQQQAQFQPQPVAYAAPEAQTFTALGPESVFVSLGLADGPVAVHNQSPVAPAVPGLEGSSVKRGRGRPRRDPSAAPTPKRVQTPDQSGGVKRRPGRPPKNVAVNAAAAAVGSTVKRRPGRPPKSATPSRRGRPRKTVAPAAANGVANVTNVPAGGAQSGQVSAPKRRGRPPRASNNQGVVGVTDVPIAAAFDSGNNFPNTVDGGVINGAPPLGKRRGRPPRSISVTPAPPVFKKQRKLSGKPRGRPKKNVGAIPAVSASPAVSDAKLVMAYEELKGKFEHIQTRIKETVNVLKPCLNSETPAIAIAALQELEELAAAGVNPVH